VLLRTTRGYFGRRKNTYKAAHETALRAGYYAYFGRRLRRRDFRALWIQRINAAAREMGLKYSTVIDMLKKADIQLDRRVLADMAYSDPAGFKAVVESARTRVS
jgi:large subunit ribosomal protein L20